MAISMYKVSVPIFVQHLAALSGVLDKAQAQLTQDQAQLENAKLDQQRYATLATRDFASRQQLDTQVATVNRLTGMVQADRAAIDADILQMGPRSG